LGNLPGNYRHADSALPPTSLFLVRRAHKGEMSGFAYPRSMPHYALALGGVPIREKRGQAVAVSGSPSPPYLLRDSPDEHTADRHKQLPMATMARFFPYLRKPQKKSLSPRFPLKRCIQVYWVRIHLGSLPSCLVIDPSLTVFPDCGGLGQGLRRNIGAWGS
jgi:hypothetical protein